MPLPFISLALLMFPSISHSCSNLRSFFFNCYNYIEINKTINIFKLDEFIILGSIHTISEITNCDWLIIYRVHFWEKLIYSLSVVFVWLEFFIEKVGVMKFPHSALM